MTMKYAEGAKLMTVERNEDTIGINVYTLTNNDEIRAGFLEYVKAKALNPSFKQSDELEIIGNTAYDIMMEVSEVLSKHISPIESPTGMVGSGIVALQNIIGVCQEMLDALEVEVFKLDPSQKQDEPSGKYKFN